MIDYTEPLEVFYPQLWAMKFAIENPRSMSFAFPHPITRLGLLVVAADKIKDMGVTAAHLRENIRWHEVKYEAQKFSHLMGELYEMIEKETHPGHNARCRKSSSCASQL